MSSREKMAVVALILIAVAISGLLACGGSAPVDVPEEAGDTSYVKLAGLPRGYGVFYLYDKERGVHCWVFKSSYMGGISCIPRRQIP